MALSFTLLGADYTPEMPKTARPVAFRFQLLALSFVVTVGVTAGFLVPGK